MKSFGKRCSSLSFAGTGKNFAADVYIDTDQHQLSDNEAAQKVLNNILLEKPVYVAHRVHFLRRGWVRYAAAVLVIIGIGAYFWNNLKVKTENLKIVQVDSIEKDVVPGSNRAILTLADGTKILLDSVANGVIASQGTSTITKTSSGNLVYQQVKNNSSRVTPSPAGGGEEVDP